MKKLFVLIPVLVFILSSCKKEPMVKVNNTNTVINIYDTVSINPIKTVSGIDVYRAYTADPNIWITGAAGTVTYGYTPADLSAYGANLAGAEFEVVFTLHSKIDITFELANQYASIDYPNSNFDMWSNGAEIVGTGRTTSEYWWTISNKILVTKPAGGTPMDMAAFMPTFHYEYLNGGNMVAADLPLYLATKYIRI